MKEFLSHLFIPKESNNHRAKILHNSNLFLTIIFLLISSFFVQTIKANFPSVLGVSANISSEELLNLTNIKRQENGVSTLSLNEKLSEAASKKAQDMFENNYWAHNSPTGKTPWVFIKASGYEYIYAGENLAKGFSTAPDAVNAWMASPDHKANMLSSNYKDVGFAVQVGTLNGEETVLIVQEFGSSNISIAKVSQAQDVATASDKNNEAQEVAAVPEVNIRPQEVRIAAVETTPAPLFNSLSFSSNINMIIVLIFIFVLILDIIIIEKKKIVRFVGHNIDHVSYLVLILVLIGIFGKGVII